MDFKFDKRRTMKPVRVSLSLKAATVAWLEEVASREGVKVDDVAQQVLDHVIDGKPKRASAAKATTAPSHQ